MYKCLSSLQSLSRVRLFATPWIAARQASLSITNSQFTQPNVYRVGDAIQPSHPLSSPLLLPPVPPSIRVFSNESTLCIRWPKYWSFSFSISASNEHPGLISFRMDWVDLLSVQGLSRVFSNTTAQKYKCLSSLQSLSRVRLFATPWIAARQASLSITNSQFTQTHVH